MTREEAAAVLGVSVNASTREIRAAYREMAKLLHPDRHSRNGSMESAGVAMARVTVAYEILSNRNPDEASERQSGRSDSTEQIDEQLSEWEAQWQDIVQKYRLSGEDESELARMKVLLLHHARSIDSLADLEKAYLSLVLHRALPSGAPRSAPTWLIASILLTLVSALLGLLGQDVNGWVTALWGSSLGFYVLFRASVHKHRDAYVYRAPHIGMFLLAIVTSAILYAVLPDLLDAPVDEIGMIPGVVLDVLTLSPREASVAQLLGIETLYKSFAGYLFASAILTIIQFPILLDLAFTIKSMRYARSEQDVDYGRPKSDSFGDACLAGCFLAGSNLAYLLAEAGELRPWEAFGLLLAAGIALGYPYIAIGKTNRTFR